ncbi:MAG: trypsin-like peptidase domain-containing protein [Anaerolineae bacterium]|nr:trypsin-like peptidase domain-containing protein [Anaerolineae bacterium]
MSSRVRWIILLVGVGIFWAGAGAALLLRAGSESRAEQPLAVARVVDSPVSMQAAALQPTPSPLPPEAVQAVDAEYLLLANVYERVSPSVVNIEVAVAFSEEIDPVQAGSGSGFIYDLGGHIVTNSHVVRDSDGIQVTFRDGYVAQAELVGIDDFSDLAVIRVDTSLERLLPVTIGDSSGLYVGQRVIAIGNPFGLESSLTSGVISALGRTLPSAQLLDPTQQPFNNPSIIQIDAEINPGNSGGPLLDSYGSLIGVNTAIRTESGQFQGVGFAVPASTVRRVVPELIETGTVAYSWLGISSLAADGGFSLAALAEPLNLPVTSGVLLQTVEPDSPADRAGLRGGTNDGTVVRGREIYVGGDIIVAINDTFVDSMDDLVGYLVVNTRPGDEVRMTVVREGQTLEVPVVLGARP